MIDKFKVFATAVQKRFNEMTKEPLFVVSSDRDKIWEEYIKAFPTGSNPVFLERTEHDCSCCRHFIRDIGNVVAVQNGVLTSVWDLNGLPFPYQDVTDAMSRYIKSLRISDIYLTKHPQHGIPFTRALLNGQTHQFNHFAVLVPQRFVSKDATEKIGNAKTTYAVLLRGLLELNTEAVVTVAGLIQNNAIYRGQEFQRAVLEFQQLQLRLLSTENGNQRELLLWTMVDSPVARFRNTVIGTLVQDLSDNKDVEAAVRAYELKVAPANYKRPTSLITKGMVKDAMKTIEELELEPALARRHARLSDVSVSSVLFVDNAVQGKMKGGVEGLLMEEVKPAKFDAKKAEEISVEDFMNTVLRKCTSVQLYIDNAVLANFVSMTAPVHEDSKCLFRWDNRFAWSYDGNVADSIKDKVKRAGGQVEHVAMRVSLAWFNTDDLDLHVREPYGNHIFYGNKDNKLDVDMNVSNCVRDPVENVRWVKTPPDGQYQVSVHNFTRRESIDVGFIVEIESPHGLDTFSFERAIPAREEVPVARITVKGGQIQSLIPSPGIIVGSRSTEKWGLKTLDLVRVNSIVLSPNHWDGNAVGNKHWFFVLEGCKNPLPTRGIYNEFLHPRLEKHRKVFEILGDKTKCPVSDDQLSGVGFSSTRKDKVTVTAIGPSFNKPYAIVF